MGLYLKRRHGETITLTTQDGKTIKITALKTTGRELQFLINCDKSIKIERGELLDKKKGIDEDNS